MCSINCFSRTAYLSIDNKGKSNRLMTGCGIVPHFSNLSFNSVIWRMSSACHSGSKISVKTHILFAGGVKDHYFIFSFYFKIQRSYVWNLCKTFQVHLVGVLQKLNCILWRFFASSVALSKCSSKNNGVEHRGYGCGKGPSIILKLVLKSRI